MLDLPDVPPPMRTIAIDVHRRPSVVWRQRPDSGEHATISGSTPPLPTPLPMPMPMHDVSREAFHPGGSDITINRDIGPFSDLHAVPEHGESSVSLGSRATQEVVHPIRHSLTPSSPSIYPESMKTAEDDADSLYQREMGISDHESREKLNVSQYRPPTPPTSISSQSDHTQTTPPRNNPVIPKSIMVRGTKTIESNGRRAKVLSKHSSADVRPYHSSQPFGSNCRDRFAL